MSTFLFECVNFVNFDTIDILCLVYSNFCTEKKFKSENEYFSLAFETNILIFFLAYICHNPTDNTLLVSALWHCLSF